MKRQGKRRVAPARAIVTQPFSSGPRNASSVSRGTRKLVEEEHAAVRQRRLARAGRVAAADNAGGADRVVGRSERAAAAEARLEPPAGAGDARDLERLLATSGGRIEGRRLAASDLPAPGGPTINRLWPPAAATSSA